jgi:predicted esterase
MDMVLTYEHGKQLAKVFHQCGLKGELSTFKGGHEIPLPIVERARTYIQSRFQK